MSKLESSYTYVHNKLIICITSQLSCCSWLFANDDGQDTQGHLPSSQWLELVGREAYAGRYYGPSTMVLLSSNTTKSSIAFNRRSPFNARHWSTCSGPSRLRSRCQPSLQLLGSMRLVLLWEMTWGILWGGIVLQQYQRNYHRRLCAYLHVSSTTRFLVSYWYGILSEYWMVQDSCSGRQVCEFVRSWDFLQRQDATLLVLSEAMKVLVQSRGQQVIILDPFIFFSFGFLFSLIWGFSSWHFLSLGRR